MVKVSVIVPVYNVEDYLAECLDSIINQTFDDIEIICVNDGSTDNSLKILERYQCLDSRIKIISKENGGLSSARNIGIDNASGKYIYFIDSDDYCSSVTIAECYDNAERNMSDIVIFDSIWKNAIDGRFIIFGIPRFADNFENRIFNIDIAEPIIYKEVPVSVWNKFYNLRFLRENNIRFYEDMIYEDVPFWAAVYTKAQRITYIPKSFYFYRRDRIGALTTLKGRESFDVIKAYSRVKYELQNSGYWDKCADVVNLLMIMDFIKKYFSIKSEFREEFFNKIKLFTASVDVKKLESQRLIQFEKEYVNIFVLLRKLSYEEFDQLVMKKGMYV